MFVLLPDLKVHVVVCPAHAGHVARSPHCPASGRPIGRDHLLLQICIIGRQGLMEERDLMQLPLESVMHFERLGHLLFFMFVKKFVILVRSCKFGNHFVGVTLVNKESLSFPTKTHLCCVLRKTMLL